jgi:hypothetical protein
MAGKARTRINGPSNKLAGGRRGPLSLVHVANRATSDSRRMTIARDNCEMSWGESANKDDEICRFSPLCSATGQRSAAVPHRLEWSPRPK